MDVPRATVFKPSSIVCLISDDLASIFGVGSSPFFYHDFLKRSKRSGGKRDIFKLILTFKVNFKGVSTIYEEVKSHGYDRITSYINSREYGFSYNV